MPSSSPHSHAPTDARNAARTELSRSNTAKSLTPQRKHRKLLKDGSGTEVWPESIEKVFVQGLRQYWESPWATYSRGRSRWRNQFLVEYLQKAGIVRSKKQVASHIQVLRNMWKGEPEFHLVAGGDELLAESGLIGSVKSEPNGESSGLIPFDLDESDTMSSTSSPNFSPPEFMSEVPPSPSHTGPPSFKMEEYSPSTHLAFPNTTLHHSPASPVTDRGFPISPSSIGSGTIPLPKAVPQPSFKSSTDANLKQHHLSPSAPARLETASHYSQPGNAANRIVGFYLQADGMTPLGITLDALVPPSPYGRLPAAILKIRLCVPTVNDTRSPATLHGFSASVSLASVWSSFARCTTRTFSAGQCISEETGPVEATSINVGTIHAMVPDSFLNRCRWSDPNAPTTITQELVVDNEVLAHVMYELDRNTLGGLPSAELLGYQSTRPNDKHVPLSQPFHRPTQSYALPHHTYGSHIPHSTQTSLSYALTPHVSVRQGR